MECVECRECYDVVLEWCIECSVERREECRGEYRGECKVECRVEYMERVVSGLYGME